MAEKSLAAPLVSVIIPVFNCEDFLAEAIGSVLGQTWSPFELIIVDDGSTDASRHIASRYADRVRLVQQPHSGAGAARNRGLQLAAGPMIAFLDADDFWRSQKLAFQMERFSHSPELDILFTGVQNFWTDELHDERLEMTGRKISQPYFGPSIQSMLARREVFDKVGWFATDRYRLRDDRDWLIRAQEARLKSEVIGEILVDRRIHRHNTTRDNRKLASDELLEAVKSSLDRRRRVGSRDD